MNSTDLAFWVPCIAVVFAVIGVWVPYRSGRRPLALFDQSATYGIAGVLGACSVGAHGVGLWLPGALGLTFGLFSYLFANRLLRHYGPPQRSASAWAVIAFSFLACGLATGLSFRLGGWLIHWQANP